MNSHQSRGRVMSNAYSKEGSPLVRHLIQAAGLIVAIIATGAVALSQIGDNEIDIASNEKAIKAIEKNIGEISTSQAVIETQLENEKENAETFREETNTKLDRILDRLP